MANLLYVNDSSLNKLKQHIAYYFWFPIIRNFPIRVVPLEERSFHPRNIEIEDDFIYLTVDMKFIYCRNGMASFLYANQDLSFRFTVSYGILRTLDNKQFSAIIGKIAKIVSSSDVELVETDKVYHPLIDSNLLAIDKENIEVDASSFEEITVANDPTTKDQGPKRRRGRPKKRSEPAAKKPKRKTTGKTTATSATASKTNKDKNSAESLLEKYSKTICDEVYDLRMNGLSTYVAIAEKLNVEKSDAKKICVCYQDIKELSK